MSPWSLRDARIDDAENVEHFLLTVPEFAGYFVPGQERNVWHWLYVRNNNTPEIAVVAQNEKNEIIGHYGLARLSYRIDKKDVQAGMICKLAIAEAYRKEPLFLKMTLKLLKGYTNKGISFLHGLVNRDGLLQFHLAFGFKKIGDIPIYVKPFRFARIAQIILPRILYRSLSRIVWFAQACFISFVGLRDHRSTSPFVIEEVLHFDHDMNNMPIFLEKYYRIFAQRNKETLNWRFLGTPFRGYRIYKIKEKGQVVGYWVLRKMDMKGFNALAIVDICFDFGRKDLANAILSFIDRIALESENDLISILVSSKELAGHLKRFCYLKSSEHFTLVVHQTKDVRNEIAITKSPIKDWFMTWFDHDFV